MSKLPFAVPTRSSFNVTRSRSSARLQPSGFDAPRSRVRRQPRDAAREQTRGFHGCDEQTRWTVLAHATRVTPTVATTS